MSDERREGGNSRTRYTRGGPWRIKDGWRFRTPEGATDLTDTQMQECRLLMGDVDARDHMRYLRDTAARYGDPLTYLQRWEEYRLSTKVSVAGG